MAHVYATRSCVLTVNGIPTPVRAGDKFRTDEAVVLQHPDIFERAVEEATAVPGQRRK